MIARGWLICLGAVACLAPAFAHGQTPADGSPPRPAEPPKQSVITIFTVPTDADLTLRGPSGLTGRTPLDLPPLMTGVHSVLVEGPGVSRTQGLIYLPEPGRLPFVVSEEPGISAPLILRGLNFPGVTNLMGNRVGRGIPLATAALGAATMAVRAHIFYRDRLDEVGDFAADRAEDERYQRNAWLTYGAAVWGLSALDYWIRPRLSLVETTSTRLTLGVPKMTRGGAIWRSILVPGAGQEYGNHRTRSIVWLSAVLVSGAGYVVADYRVRRDDTDLTWAQTNVDSAGPSTVVQRQRELDQAERSLEASKDIRTGFLIGIASFHALNIVDAMIMYLSLPAPDKPKVSSISPIMLPDGPGVGVTLHF